MEVLGDIARHTWLAGVLVKEAECVWRQSPGQTGLGCLQGVRPSFIHLSNEVLAGESSLVTPASLCFSFFPLRSLSSLFSLFPSFPFSFLTFVSVVLGMSHVQ